MKRRVLKRAGGAVLILAAIGFVVFKASPLTNPRRRVVSVGERVRAFPAQGLPLRAPATIYWDPHLIPFIDAQTDEDGAFLLGMTHAHLRLGQMELMKRVAQGRLSEMFGPFTGKVDHFIRLIDLGRSARAIEAAMPAETALWMGRFTDGINFYQQHVDKLPLEFRVAGLPREPWSVRDVITLGKLSAVDVNWFNTLAFLSMRRPGGRELPGWKNFFDRCLGIGMSSAPTFPEKPGMPGTNLLRDLGRTGSNSYVLSPSASGQGGAVIASDPHLGISVPGMFLISGLRSPSFHVVGLSFPGLPFAVLGRNEEIAWGGSNMRAASSDFYDVSAEPPGSIRSTPSRIGVRGWFDSDIGLRESRLGPVIGDAPLLPLAPGERNVALHWVGHEPTDEFTTLHRFTRARSFEEFRRAFETYGVSGQNILYADARGNIGAVPAVKLPVRSYQAPPDLVLDPRDPKNLWIGYKGTLDLPFALNPDPGFLVSCNNAPTASPVPIGFFFASNDRVLRIESVLREHPAAVDLQLIEELQRDTVSYSSLRARDLFVKTLTDVRLAAPSGGPRRAWLEALRQWDGSYSADSKGAVAYQALLYHFASRYYPTRYGEAVTRFLLGSEYLNDFVIGDLDQSPLDARPALEQAVQPAALAFARAPNWGSLHQLRLAHPFGRVPFLGRGYRFGDYGVGGSSTTPMKTAHHVSDTRHTVSYGSTARHISLMSDLDSNYFCLLGGQDGWLTSEATVDQVPLWMERRYIRVPMRIETVRREFPYEVKLAPAGAPAAAR